MTSTAVRAEGHCEPRFEAVRVAFEAGFTRHGELGGCVSVVQDGRTVVDLWGGHEDEARTQPWRRDALANVFSVTKGVVSLCLAMLLDRGRLDPEARVCDCWPEMAAEGKGEMRVRDLLAHRAGLPALRAQLPPDAHLDWQRMTEALAAERPWWKPGRRFGYHPMTWGWLAGELLRRLDGRTPGTFLREELAAPLGLDLHLGTPPELDARIAPIGTGGSAVAPRVLAYWACTPWWMPLRLRTFTNPPQIEGKPDTRKWRAAEIPAANLHGNARALAALYGAVARGAAGASDAIVRPAALARATRIEVDARDLVFGFHNRMGLGFMLDGRGLALGSGGHAFGHTGAGGALAFGDVSRRLGFAYVPNRPHVQSALLVRSARAVVDAIHRCV